MNKPVVQVQVRAVATTSGSCAVFLGNEEKVFVICIEQSVGAAIAMFMQGTQKRSGRSPMICLQASCEPSRRRSKG